SARMRRNPSRLVLNSCEVHKINFSPNRNREPSVRASKIAPLPFWRGSITATSGADQRPSGSWPRPSITARRCASSSTSPAEAARSTTSSPALSPGRGPVRNLGGDTGGAASCKLVNRIHLLVLRLPYGQTTQLGQRQP